MAKPRPYPDQRNCGRCSEPVREDGDFRRAHLRSAVLLFYWSCFVRQMRENDERKSA
jgi:hypothetical protein